MKTRTKPEWLLVHNATLDGSQDEWRVSRLVDGRYISTGSPLASEDEAKAALALRKPGAIHRTYEVSKRR